ncbi:hypothetical protein CR513_27663, partial [Mucuna pruriens]
MARFLHGLNREVQDIVELYHYTSLANLVHQATKVELKLKRCQASKKSYPRSRWKGKDKERERQKMTRVLRRGVSFHKTEKRKLPHLALHMPCIPVSPRFLYSRLLSHGTPCIKPSLIYFKLPKSILSYRDSKFFSHFWKTLWGQLGTKLMFCTTWHPQMDDQIKLVNRMLTQLLRYFMGKNLKSLETWLPYIEFSYNRMVNEITSHLPFKQVYVRNPLSSLDLIPLHVPSKAKLEGLSKAYSIVRLHE